MPHHNIGHRLELAIHEKHQDQMKISLENTLRLIGYVIYFNTYSTWQGKCIHMEDIYVVPEYRSKGIGSKLIGSVCKVADLQNCGRVQFIVRDSNKSAMKFYKHQGAIDLTEVQEWHLFRLTMEAHPNSRNTDPGAMNFTILEESSMLIKIIPIDVQEMSRNPWISSADKRAKNRMIVMMSRCLRYLYEKRPPSPECMQHFMSLRPGGKIVKSRRRRGINRNVRIRQMYICLALIRDISDHLNFNDSYLPSYCRPLYCAQLARSGVQSYPSFCTNNVSITVIQK
uniref:Diamine acetyltransferase 2 n=1 Tax=Magallana gigas TaxID=29159 RepID=K1QW18_MAGGI